MLIAQVSSQKEDAMLYQTTLAQAITFDGIGLHSGRAIRMTLRPAEAGRGIVFHRSEGTQTVSIEAISANVVDTRLATVLGKNDLSVSTVEHILGALRALGIDNLHIDINGPEVPVMDGSAAPFISALQNAGIVQQRRERKYLVIRKPFSVVDGDKSVSVTPSRFYRISCEIDFNHPGHATTAFIGAFADGLARIGIESRVVGLTTWEPGWRPESLDVPSSGAPWLHQGGVRLGDIASAARLGILDDADPARPGGESAPAWYLAALAPTRPRHVRRGRRPGRSRLPPLPGRLAGDRPHHPASRVETARAVVRSTHRHPDRPGDARRVRRARGQRKRRRLGALDVPG